MVGGMQERLGSDGEPVAVRGRAARFAVLAFAAGAAVAAAGIAWAAGAGPIATAALGGTGAVAVLAGAAVGRTGRPEAPISAPGAFLGPAQYRQILDQAPVRVSIKDASGRFVFINRASEEWFGLDAKAVVGRATEEVFPPDLARTYGAIDRRVLETGLPQQTQVTHARGDRTFHASVRKFAVRGDDGGVAGIATIAVDVTSRNEAERALLDAKEAAERASHLKSAFLAAMSHELRTPLNAIIGFSDLIAMEPYGPLGDVRYRDYVGDIGASGRHLLGIVNDILDLARIEAGRETLTEETVDLEALIETVMRTMQVRADQAGVDLRLRLMRSLPLLSCDPRRVRQILFNLVSNGVKFTPRGGLVTVAARVVGDLEIEVRDTGIGIEAHEIPTLFEPFNRVVDHLTRGVEGAGLGLALTRRFVQMHGGTISVSSTPGTGTAVTVRIPAARLVERAGAEAPA